MASLNKVILMGNLTADPELKTTPSGVSVVSFSIAVGRRLSKEQQVDPNAVKADFINIVAWRGTAEFICNYFSKGKSIVIVGQIQVRSYTAQDGSKRYVTEVVADEVTFGSNAATDSSGSSKGIVTSGANAAVYGNGKASGAEAAGASLSVADAEFVEVSEDDDLPF